MSRFTWEDPLLLDDQLTEDERMLRDGARSFAQDVLAPKVIEAYREETVDPGMFKQMGDAGLLGLTIPEQYGGLGAGYVTYGLVAREIERVDSGAAAEIPAGLGCGRPDWLLWANRAGRRVRPGWHEDRRAQDRHGLRVERRQDVDFQRAICRCVRGLGQVRGPWRFGPRPRARL